MRSQSFGQACVACTPLDSAGSIRYPLLVYETSNSRWAREAVNVNVTGTSGTCPVAEMGSNRDHNPTRPSSRTSNSPEPSILSGSK